MPSHRIHRIERNPGGINTPIGEDLMGPAIFIIGVRANL